MRRKARRTREQAPVFVGVVEVVRSSDRRLQVQSATLPKPRMWIEREDLHPLSKAQSKGDVGELVLKARAAKALGVSERLKESND